MSVEQIVQQAFAKSDVVFVGRVIEGRLGKNEQLPNSAYYTPADYAEYTFSVDQHWKGVSSATIKIRTGLGGGDCGILFNLVRTYALYTRKIDAYDLVDAHLYTGLCDRTARAGNEDVRILRQIVGD